MCRVAKCEKCEFHLVFGLAGLSVNPIQTLLVKDHFFGTVVDSVDCDHSVSHCYTEVISSFSDFWDSVTWKSVHQTVMIR